MSDRAERPRRGRPPGRGVEEVYAVDPTLAAAARRLIARFPRDDSARIAARLFAAGVVAQEGTIRRIRAGTDDGPSPEVLAIVADPENVALVARSAERHARALGADPDDAASIALAALPRTVGSWIDRGRPIRLRALLVLDARRHAQHAARRSRFRRTSPIDLFAPADRGLSPPEQAIFNEELARMREDRP